MVRLATVVDDYLGRIGLDVVNNGKIDTNGGAVVRGRSKLGA